MEFNWRTDGQRMAYADDLVLLAETGNGMQAMLEEVFQFLENLDMKLPFGKCQCFQYISAGTTWAPRNPKLLLGDQEIFYIPPNTAFTYSGYPFTSNRGKHVSYTADVLELMLLRLGRLRLRPRQKVHLMEKHLLPKFLYQWTVAEVHQTFLTEVDGLIRKAVKLWLPLPMSTADALIYSAKRDGGLVVQRMTSLVRRAVTTMLIGLRDTRDPVVFALLPDSDTDAN